MNTYEATDGAGRTLITVQAPDETQARERIRKELCCPQRAVDHLAWLRAGAPVRVLATQLRLL